MYWTNPYLYTLLKTPILENNWLGLQDRYLYQVYVLFTTHYGQKNLFLGLMPSPISYDFAKKNHAVCFIPGYSYLFLQGTHIYFFNA